MSQRLRSNAPPVNVIGQQTLQRHKAAEGIICRFSIPTLESPLVRRLAEITGVREWTDLGSGDGTKILALTQPLNLTRCSCVLISTAQTVARLQGHKLNVYEQDIRDWVAQLPKDYRGDCVSLLDVIEHFDLHEAVRLMDILAKLFRVVIIFTPRGYMRQDGIVDPELADNPLMWHRSGFTEEDFIARGYLTFYWPIYHFPPNVPPAGAVLAIRVDGARQQDLIRYKRKICRLYWSLLFRTTSFPGFLARLGVWSIGGNRGVRACMRWKRQLSAFLK